MIFIGTHHKTGTTLFLNVFYEVSQLLGLKFSLCGQSRLPPDTQIWFQEHSRIRVNAFTEIEGVHVIRHPLEVICSGYRYHLVCRESWCISTAIDGTSPVNYNFEGLSYQQKLRTLSTRDGILFEMKHRSFPVIMDMYNWNYADRRFLNVKLEDVMAEFDREFSKIFAFLGFDPSECLPIARRHDTKRLSRDQVASMEHVTNKMGELPWTHYFSDNAMLEQFSATFPDDLLPRLGYP
jgi:hypothetical protein